MGIGKHLRRYMEREGVSEAEVMELLGLDAVRFDELAEDAFSLGVSDLLKLATLLKTDIPALLHGKEYRERKAIKTSVADRVVVRNQRTLDYESLAPSYVGRKMEPFLVTIYRRNDADVEISRHDGEEFLFITQGTLKIVVDGESHLLNEGDSFYFDSSLPHSVNAVTEKVALVSSIYKGESMVHRTRGRRMKAIIEAAKLLSRRNIVVISPDKTALSAINLAIEEEIIDKAYLVGKRAWIDERCEGELRFPAAYEYVEVTAEGDAFEPAAARAGVAIIRKGLGHMIMKGKVNSNAFLKAILNRSEGIGTGRRLSLVGIFEVPGVDRLLMLTDPGINPELFVGDDVASGVDIVRNAIDVAKSLGVARPKVALLDANEVPTDSIPTTVFERNLSEMAWEDADVVGPLSYDLALYESFVKAKGITGDPVAGKADILVVPYIATGNILYKSWAFTMGAEVANVVLGASAPIIMTSRSDSDIVKFLTICASALYSNWLEGEKDRR
ncbi:phosphate acyltransferase [Desulfoluna sp.]|uniref:phosphate acyltransferase n=1 Tax=Desulfoluna sp. TaxID=2045199 RepID=UPI00260FA1C7|nr:phosphate acyltransferase [Desulfoluna sp.]